jgi:septum site-determining protein MinC
MNPASIDKMPSAIMETGEHAMNQDLKSAIQIKGIREGLLISLGGGSFQDAQQQLLDHIDHQTSFFRGARLALDTGEMKIKAGDLGSLRDKLSERGVALWAVLSAEPATDTTARMLGLATHLAEIRQEKLAVEQKPPVNSGDGAILVRKTLRSGVHLEHDGHVAVIGDVNPGAEVSATGCVVVWGRLLGSVHAGSRGDEKAVICALEMSPTYIHIAGCITQPPPRKGRPQPELARILNDEIILETWKA